MSLPRWATVLSGTASSTTSANAAAAASSLLDDKNNPTANNQRRKIRQPMLLPTHKSASQKAAKNKSSLDEAQIVQRQYKSEAERIEEQIIEEDLYLRNITYNELMKRIDTSMEKSITLYTKQLVNELHDFFNMVSPSLSPSFSEEEQVAEQRNGATDEIETTAAATMMQIEYDNGDDNNNEEEKKDNINYVSSSFNSPSNNSSNKRRRLDDNNNSTDNDDKTPQVNNTATNRDKSLIDLFTIQPETNSYDQSLLPIAMIRCTSSSLADRSAIIQNVSNQLKQMRRKHYYHSSDDNNNNSNPGVTINLAGDMELEEQKQQNGEDNDGNTENRTDSYYTSPAVCVISSSSYGGDNNNNVNTSNNHLNLLIQDILKQCILQEEHPKIFEKILKQCSSEKNSSSSSSKTQSLLTWASYTEQFDSIYILIENIESFTNSSNNKSIISDFLHLMSTLRNEYGLPVCIGMFVTTLVVNDLGSNNNNYNSNIIKQSCYLGTSINSLRTSTGSMVGTLVKDFITLPSSYEIYEKIYEYLFVGCVSSSRSRSSSSNNTKLPISIPYHTIRTIHTSFVNHTSSFVQTIQMFKQSLLYHLSKRGSFFTSILLSSLVSTVDDEDDDDNNNSCNENNNQLILQNEWNRLAWFCVDRNARQYCINNGFYGDEDDNDDDAEKTKNKQGNNDNGDNNNSNKNNEGTKNQKQQQQQQQQQTTSNRTETTSTATAVNNSNVITSINVRYWLEETEQYQRAFSIVVRMIHHILVVRRTNTYNTKQQQQQQRQRQNYNQRQQNNHYYSIPEWFQDLLAPNPFSLSSSASYDDNGGTTSQRWKRREEYVSKLINDKTQKQLLAWMSFCRKEILNFKQQQRRRLLQDSKSNNDNGNISDERKLFNEQFASENNDKASSSLTDNNESSMIVKQASLFSSSLLLDNLLHKLNELIILFGEVYNKDEEDQPLLLCTNIDHKKDLIQLVEEFISYVFIEGSTINTKAQEQQKQKHRRCFGGVGRNKNNNNNNCNPLMSSFVMSESHAKLCNISLIAEQRRSISNALLVNDSKWKKKVGNKNKNSKDNDRFNKNGSGVKAATYDIPCELFSLISDRRYIERDEWFQLFVKNSKYKIVINDDSNGGRKRKTKRGNNDDTSYHYKTHEEVWSMFTFGIYELIHCGLIAEAKRSTNCKSTEPLYEKKAIVWSTGQYA